VKVVAIQADQTGCGKFRIEWPCKAINDLGLAEVEVRESFAIKLGDTEYGRAVVDLDLPIDTDILVFQRPTTAQQVSALMCAQRFGIKVVVEIDDNIVNLPPKHPLRGRIHPGAHPEMGCVSALVDACKIADLVTTTTPALAAVYAPHGRVAVLPNCLPTWYVDAAAYYRQEVNNPVPVVGYVGAGAFHSDDLEVVGNGLKQAQENTGFVFKGLGGDDFAKRLRVKGESDGTWRDIEDLSPKGYIAALAQFDIGLAPLQQCAFNDGKSDLKLLEMAAFGTPTICTPIPAYVGARVPGTSYARTPAEWRIASEAAVNGQQWREGIADKLQSYVRSRTFEAQAHRWVEAWSEICA
jgi:glycosyltransferase involved in cell wall biosynthesis